MDAQKQQMKGQQGHGTMPAFLMNVPRPGFRRPAAACAAPVPESLPEPVKLAATQPAATSVIKEASPEPAQSAVVEVKKEASPEPAQPAVVMVKKGRAGCAIVLLRDPAIIERCVLQRVAVIDGVCVEMTRHTKKKKAQEEEDVETPAGIFCAWGVRVERRFPVSSEGLEEFFNSLVGKQSPEGLVALAPFQEGHLSFPLTSESPAPFSSVIREIPADAEEILSSAHCEEKSILALRKAKNRLDALWELPPPPVARSLMQRIARSQLFPHSGEGGQEHENRAGDKLAELVAVTHLLDGIPSGAAFLDLCGGPGSWSQHLLGHQDLALRGFGFTLKSGAVGAVDDWQADEKDDWYPDLHAHPDWTALWGADGTGDLLKPGNLQHAAKQLAKEKVLLCVADGGFSDKAIPPNLLELYFYRLLLGELLMAASCLKQGGKFVCKMYTAFSASTSALLFLTTRLFDSVEIVKPMSSRATGPERYLVASGFRDNAETASVRAVLERSHAVGNGASPLALPLLAPAVAAASMAQDRAFTASMTTMVSTTCERQALALNAVVDRAEFLEEMAMDSAVCSDPFCQTACERREEIVEGRQQAEQQQQERDRDRNSKWRRNIPTPARGGARQNNWRGNQNWRGGQ